MDDDIYIQVGESESSERMEIPAEKVSISI